MWDESLPSYDGSFEHNLIVLTLYFRVFIYYLISVLGVLTAIIISVLPFVGIALGYKSVIIKIKQDKHHKKLKKKQDKEQQIKQNLYLNDLDKKLKKKKKSKHS